MSKADISITLPLDKDGFLRRECPNCKRQFKWLPTKDKSNKQSQLQYYCPYCGKLANINDWWTKEQVQYIKQKLSKATEPELEKFTKDLKRLNKPGSLIRIEPKYKLSSEPLPFHEPNVMRKVEPPCHTSEPLKIYENWNKLVICLICGKPFSLD